MLTGLLGGGTVWKGCGPVRRRDLAGGSGLTDRWALRFPSPASFLFMSCFLTAAAV